MFQISHECPVCLLSFSHLFNDYDYCLVHLTDELSNYKKFYKNSARQGREVLLDNSIFELGVAFKNSKFIKKIKSLQPTQYIVPDVWNDCEKTIKSFQHFLKYSKGISGKKIGALQGKTYEELKKCYQFMSQNADKIAVSFGLDYFLETGKGSNKLEDYSVGRTTLIKRLQDDGVWNYDKPHHLLGCSLYREFTENKEFYKKSNFVSLDTSNPIVAGMKGLKYDGTKGLDEKPSIKLFTLINEELTSEQLRNVFYNIVMFKEGLY